MGELREKLREMDLRLTDLAYYMQISRPTVYKLIDDYEEGRRRDMKKSDLDLFKFIMRKSTDDRRQVLLHIINEYQSETANESVGKMVTRYENSKGCSPEKISFIENIVKTDVIDEIIPYLNRYILSVERNIDMNSEEKNKYRIFRDKVLENTK